MAYALDMNWLRRRVGFFRRHLGFVLESSSGLEARGAGKWLASIQAPSIRYRLTEPMAGGGWVLLRCRLLRRGTNCVARLCFDSGDGFDAGQAIEVPATRKGLVAEAIYFPPGTQALRWEPVQATGYFEQSFLELVRIDPLERMARMWFRVLAMMYLRPGRELAAAGVTPRRAVFDLAGAYRAASRLFAAAPALSYRAWLGRCETVSASDRLRAREQIDGMDNPPLISVVMPVFDPPEALLIRAIESVRKQWYGNWELCIADDASTDPAVGRVLARYAAIDARIKVSYRQVNGHISAASNSALALAGGEFVALLDHDDVLAEQALYRVALEIDAHPEAALIYSDEDKIDEFGQRFDPYFKPDWNPQLFLAQNFVSHLGVFRTELVRAVGGFRLGFEGSQDYDLALRVGERAGPDEIRHIAQVLYHWGARVGSTALGGAEKPYAWEAGRRALADHLQRTGVAGTVTRVGRTAFYRVHYRLAAEPSVSIVIPTRNGYELLRRCIDSLFGKTRYLNFEVLVVDNRSDDPATRRFLERLGKLPCVRVIAYDQPFNYAAINNLAAREAKGDVLCLLNDDTEIVSPDWLHDMLGYLQQEHVGVVGAKLFYPDGAVQHAGVLLHPRDIAVHAHAGLSRRDSGYFGRAIVAQDFMAVTGACFMVRRSLYKLLGGLDEANLGVAFNDVDFCLRVREAGYRVVWTPFARLLHRESATRGGRDSPGKRVRFAREKAYMRRRWGEVLERDPFYHPNLNPERPDFSLNGAPSPSRPWSNWA